MPAPCMTLRTMSRCCLVLSHHTSTMLPALVSDPVFACSFPDLVTNVPVYLGGFWIFSITFSFAVKAA